MNNPLNAPGVIVLDTEPTDPTGKYTYKAILVRNHSDSDKPWERGLDGAWILKIVGIYDDMPSLTPGQWYLDTLLGYDDYGRYANSDFIYVDAGQGWKVGNMLAVLKEAQEIAYGKINEKEEEKIRFSNADLFKRPDMRNWYQKPENLKGYKKPQPIQLKKRKKQTPEIFSRKLELRTEINDLKQEIKDIHQSDDELGMEREDFLGWIQTEYDWKVLDILAAGASDEDKIQSLEEWNMDQDTKDKNIPDSKSLIDEYNRYYPAEEDLDKKIDDIENKIKEKYKELYDLEDMYE